jgi:NAD+ diphosphatase
MSARIDLGPKPTLGYTDSRIERAAEMRTDEAAIARLAADPRSRAYVIGVELIIMKQGSAVHDPLFTGDEIIALGGATETVFLGLVGGAPRFGVGITAAAAESLKGKEPFVVTDLRSVAMQGLVAPEHLPPIAEAKAVLHWHARHRYCSNCGTFTSVLHAGWRRDCPQCNTQHFPRTDPVVIMLATRGERCLLGRSPRFAPTMWSCLAGFVEPGEAIEDAVRRETLEETGIHTGRIRYYRSQPWPFPMSLMIGAHAAALNDDVKVDRSELEDARWFGKAEVESMLMRRHHGGLTTPAPVAIAHHIMRAWVDGEFGFD